MDSVKVIENSRTIVLNGEITDEMAADTSLALLLFEADNPEERITLMINSTGGSVSAGWQIIDTIQLVGNVEVIATGLVCSMAALILLAGEKGFRSALKHSRIMLHQPLGAASFRQVSDMEIAAREMIRSKSEIYQFIAEQTGKPLEKIESDCDRDLWLSSDAALRYGVIDRIITPENR